MTSDDMRIKVTNCTFRSNTGQRGSAIYWVGGALIISDSTFESHSNDISSTNDGGAVYFYYTLDTAEDKVLIGEFSCTN